MITAQFILFFFAFLVICIFVMGALNRDLRDKRYLSTMGCLMSVMLIVCVCFFPFPYQDELLQTMITDGEGLGNNFIPFHTIISIFGEAITYHTYGTLCYQFFGNILLFIPFGFSLCYYFKEGKKFFKVLCCIILVTVLVEVWQGAFNAMLQVNYRCVDIDDVMLNTIGGIFGFCVAYFGIPRLQTIFKKTKNN